MIRVLLLIAVGLITSVGYSQDLVYKPKNPAFGGDSFNYSWLLSSAESQNLLEDGEDDRFRDDQSDLENFTQNLNSQFLNSISRSLFTQQFGTEGLAPGTYTFGSLSIEVFPTLEGLVINILDTDTGEQSMIIVPNQ